MSALGVGFAVERWEAIAHRDGHKLIKKVTYFFTSVPQNVPQKEHRNNSKNIINRCDSMRIFRIIFTLAIAFSLMGKGIAGELIEKLMKQTDNDGLSFRIERLPDSHFKILSFTLCTYQRFSDIENVMGYASIDEDWSYHIDRICYISGSDGTVIDFYTGLGFVTGFALKTREFGASDSGDCTRSDLVSKELATESGIKLGMRKNEIKKIIGVPALEAENKLAFRYKWLEEITDPRRETSSRGKKAISIL